MALTASRRIRLVHVAIATLAVILAAAVAFFSYATLRTAHAEDQFPGATLTIVKRAVGGDGRFHLTGSNPQTHDSFFDVFFETDSGTHEASETFLLPMQEPTPLAISDEQQEGWYLGKVICRNEEGFVGSADLKHSVIHLVLSPGEHVTCVLYNMHWGVLEVIKRTIGGDGKFGFNGGKLGDFQIVTEQGTGERYIRVPGGTYTVNETDLPPGWRMVSNGCVGIHVDLGERKECVIVNVHAAHLTVTKRTVGGDDTFPFTGSLDAIGSFQLTTDPQTHMASSFFDVFVEPDTPVTLTEFLSPAWRVLDIHCSYEGTNAGNTTGASVTFGLSPGDDVHCTFTNVLRQVLRTKGVR